jgi:hypothetical protein
VNRITIKNWRKTEMITEEDNIHFIQLKETLQAIFFHNAVLISYPV